MTSVTSTLELAPGASARRVEATRGEHRRPSRPNLEDIILGAWEDLGARGLADCPVCHGPLEPAGCRGCGSHLS